MNSDDDGVVVAAGAPRKEIVLAPNPKLEAKKAEARALSARTADTSVGFLMQKKDLTKIIDCRIKKLDGGKSIMKKTKVFQKKIDAKQCDTDDLPTTSADILARAKTMVKELKACKAKLPKLKKAEIPAQQKVLSGMSDSYEDSWLHKTIGD